MFRCLPARFVLLLFSAAAFLLSREASHLVRPAPLLGAIRTQKATGTEGTGGLGLSPLQVEPGTFHDVLQSRFPSSLPNPRTVPGLIKLWQPLRGKPA